MTPTRALPADATSPGLAFHRLVFARRRSAWWTPLLTGLLGVALYAVMLLIVVAVVIVASLLVPGAAGWMMSITETAAFDLTDPLSMLLLLGTIVLMLPAYVIASRIVNGARVGLVSSAAGRLRWGWMLQCTALAAVLATVLTVATFLLPSDADATGAGVVPPSQNPALWASLAVIVLVVPLQAAAEEYVFRGYLQQAIGRWLRHPLFAILLPVPLFVLGHLYDPLGQAAVGLFAVVAGWLTWRTGGLEAAIALHVVNNLSAFLLALMGLSDVNESAPGVASFVFSFVITVGFAALVEVLLRRRPLPRTLVLTAPVVPVAPQVPVAVPAGSASTP
ncbi:CPBP family intramembrane metalloprotease [Microbacterium sp. W1N]|uniref:CPBP family intramembrane glutamic endopeptidase n=1 Tax=Microbacterium festucae TaxID=2977531 RepID=UPI0021C0BD7A|nr:type II CAAX endopeptidase family protein [Microbacterium festucae]MCT9821102.1 CPBP family intramembrane metalloprotease [Microbacterium festucae]